MANSFFFLPFTISFVVAMALLIFFIMLGKKNISKDDRISKRHSHGKGISRFGGVALIISFVIAIILDKNLFIDAPLLGVIISCILILFFGVLDDIKQISWKIQLFLQSIVVLLIYIMGVKLTYITNPFGGILLFDSGFGYVIGFIVSVIWIMFIMNAMNWIDGSDGIAGGVTLIGIISIFFLSLRPEVNQPPIAIITMSIMGGLLAFIIFNFYPAKIMAGTSGANFMGFILAVLAIFAGAKIATTLLVLVVPIVDALWVMLERSLAGKSIFLADKRHLHFKLSNMGWSSKKICLFYYGITALVAMIALNTNTIGKAWVFVFIIVTMTFFLISLYRRKNIVNL